MALDEAAQGSPSAWWLLEQLSPVCLTRTVQCLLRMYLWVLSPKTLNLVCLTRTVQCPLQMYMWALSPSPLNLLCLTRTVRCLLRMYLWALSPNPLNLSCLTRAVRCLLRMYLRTRLRKVEQHATFILNDPDTLVGIVSGSGKGQPGLASARH